MYRRVLLGLMLATLLMALPLKAMAAAPDLHATAALLIDGQTGQVLYSMNPQAKMYPASTTKVLTALVAAEHAQLSDQITVSAQAVNQPYDSSLAGLRQGEKLTLEQLLYGLLLPSGNDAAVAIAEGVAGSEQAFTDLMNQKARDLGATNSHFANASGLHDPQHYTTASDLALIARAAFHDPIIARIASTEEYTLPGNRKEINHDGLLGYYDGVVAGKTGFTEQAGRTLVVMAHRNQRELIAVVLNSRLLYTDAMALLDYGFNAYSQVVVVKAGQAAGTTAVSSGAVPFVTAVTGQDFVYDLPVGAPQNPTTQARIDENLKAPLTAGQKIGELSVRMGDTELGRVDLVTEAAVPYRSPFVTFADNALTEARWWRWAAGAGCVVGIAGLRLAYVARRRRRRRLVAHVRPRSKAVVTNRRIRS